MANRTDRHGRPEIPGAVYILNAVGVVLIVLAVVSGAGRAVADAAFGIGFLCIVAGAVVAVRSGALGYRGARGDFTHGAGGYGSTGTDGGGGDVGGSVGGYVGGDFGGGGGGGGHHGG